jgi:hypothetical protein
MGPSAASGRLRQLGKLALRIPWDTAEHLPGSWSVQGTLAVGFHTPPSRLAHAASSDPANPSLSVSD